jgi:predicted nucleotidyltransferase
MKHIEISVIKTREKAGNQLRYQANRRSPIFEELAGILRKTSGLADVLRDALARLARRIEVALIFGSVAKGAEKAGSDVDVLLIGDIGFADAVKALHAAQQEIGREINPVAMSPLEFRRKVKGRDSLVRNVLAKETLFLMGDDIELAKLAGHRAPAKA